MVISRAGDMAKGKIEGKKEKEISIAGAMTRPAAWERSLSIV